MAAHPVPDSAPPATAEPLNLKSLQVRELIRELAETEAVLRQRPGEKVRGVTVHRQALIVGELRRRRRQGVQNPRRYFPVTADGGPLARE